MVNIVWSVPLAFADLSWEDNADYTIQYLIYV